MNVPVIEKIKRLPKQTEVSLRDAFSVLMSVENRREVGRLRVERGRISF